MLTPNSTQTLNFYYDELMTLLTDAEWKVLSYSIRRTFGFHKTSSPISLTQFTDGLPGKDHGCGKSRQSVLTCLQSLEKYKVIQRQPNSSGNEADVWELVLDEEEIDLPGLSDRKAEAKSANAIRTEQGRAKVIENRSIRQTNTGLSDRPVEIDNTGLSDRPVVSLSDRPALSLQKEREKERYSPSESATALPLVTANAGETPKKTETPKAISEGVADPILPRPPRGRPKPQPAPAPVEAQESEGEVGVTADSGEAVDRPRKRPQREKTVSPKSREPWEDLRDLLKARMFDLWGRDLSQFTQRKIIAESEGFKKLALQGIRPEQLEAWYRFSAPDPYWQRTGFPTAAAAANGVGDWLRQHPDWKDYLNGNAETALTAYPAYKKTAPAPQTSVDDEIDAIMRACERAQARGELYPYR